MSFSESNIQNLSVFWFKRDLRLIDNQALTQAASQGKPLLLLYILEPGVEANAHYSARHFDFIRESIVDLNLDLARHETGILAVRGEVLDILEALQEKFQISTLCSSEETGINLTFDRDKQVKAYCKKNGIIWTEFPQNGVVRGKKNRDAWREGMTHYLLGELLPDPLRAEMCLPTSAIAELAEQFETVNLEVPEHVFQKGGRTEGLKWADSFFEKRIVNYAKFMSKPALASSSCSRLSPYFAWGNLSIREVYQRAYALRHSNRAFQMEAFASRLRWQSHFIQKFESEARMEFEAVNKGFLNLAQPKNEEFIEAWKQGRTGYPLVDAAMRAVKYTGYINFRMRALVTSFLTHHLFQHFTSGSAYLAQQFLDFEPGIHYGQMQMQAGFTGINTVRIYNPTKNALEHDPEAIFIKTHLPELAQLPAFLAIEPWKSTPMEALMYDFDYGRTYPLRIVDIDETRLTAITALYELRKSSLAQREFSNSRSAYAT